MEITLHIGAHRTGTSTLQRALAEKKSELEEYGLTFWGPGVLRREYKWMSFNRRSAETYKYFWSEMEALESKGQTKLLISEENTMGSMLKNLRSSSLYPNLDARLAWYSDVFGNNCRRVVLSIRPYEDYWASVIAYEIPNLRVIPDEVKISSIFENKRSWRDVILEVANAFPNAEVRVWNFDEMVGRTDLQFPILTGAEIPVSFDPVLKKYNASKPLETIKNILALNKSLELLNVLNA